MVKRASGLVEFLAVAILAASAAIAQPVTFGNSILQLPAAGPLTGSETLPIVQSGTTSRTLSAPFLKATGIVNVKTDFNAVGNGIADDTTVIQNAINSLPIGGIVFFPPAVYCTKGGLTLSSAVTLLGSGHSNVFVNVSDPTGPTVLSACGANVAVVTMNATAAQIRDLSVLGNNATSTTQPAVNVSSGCVSCKILNVSLRYGTSNILDGGHDTQVNLVRGSLAYGTALVRKTAFASRYIQAYFDQGAPTGTTIACLATSSCSFVAWAATTVYAANAVVSDGGFYIVATVGGTSGSTLPAVPAYGSTVADGTVTWALIEPTGFSSFSIEGTATQVELIDTDSSGMWTTGISITSSGGGTTHSITNSVVGGGALTAGLFANSATSFMAANNEIDSCGGSGCSDVQLGASFTGSALIQNNSILGSNTNGILISNDSSALVSNNKITGTTLAVSVAAAVSNFVVSNNFCTNGGITVATGASNHYNIVNNIGCTVTDNGTGANKTLTGNN